MGRNNNAHRAIHPRKLFDDDAVLDCNLSPGAADIFWKKSRPGIPTVPSFLMTSSGKDLRLVPLHDMRQDFRMRKFADGAAKLNLFRRVLEFHGARRSSSRVASQCIVPSPGG